MRRIKRWSVLWTWPADPSSFLSFPWATSNRTRPESIVPCWEHLQIWACASVAVFFFFLFGGGGGGGVLVLFFGLFFFFASLSYFFRLGTYILLAGRLHSTFFSSRRVPFPSTWALEDFLIHRRSLKQRSCKSGLKWFVSMIHCCMIPLSPWLWYGLFLSFFFS